MDTKLESILKKINYKNDYFVEFIDAKVDRVNANGSKLDIVIHNKTNLTTEAYNELEKSFKDFFNIEEIYLYIIVDEIDNDKLLNEYKNIIGLLKKEKSLLEIFEDSLAFEEEKYLIKAAHEFEKATIEKYIPRITEYLEKRGFDIDIDVVLSLEERENIKNTINNDLEIKIPTTKAIKQEEKAPTKTNFTNFGKPKYEKKEVNEDTIKGRVIKDDAVSIKTIVGEEESVTIEGEVFGTEEFEPSSKAFKILTIKLTDYSDSIYCKIFSRDEEEFASLKKNCKVGAWLKIRGSTKLDKYAGNEIVLNIRDINKIPPKRTKKIVDDAPVKRVELHAHTMMSQMDGVTKLDLGKHTCELVSNAIEAGYRGVAITDHNGCQAFPISYQLIRAHNKKIENVKESFQRIIWNRINTC